MFFYKQSSGSAQSANHLQDHLIPSAKVPGSKARYESRNKSDVLTIIVDSMDRTKFAWPRFGFHRKPKLLDGVVRPRLVLTAAIAHGYCTCLYLAHEKVC